MHFTACAYIVANALRRVQRAISVHVYVVDQNKLSLSPRQSSLTTNAPQSKLCDRTPSFLAVVLECVQLELVLECSTPNSLALSFSAAAKHFAISHRYGQKSGWRSEGSVVGVI
ncbi:unnamed protein product [Onchocerca ochengi]|uniref:Secreted protein n=1 Tax=Onchocerca ochengi TaxID=42157 RepID=A0A182DYC6_ONCOC|nr:unnamed protein product [Onchocerca ochengi]